MIKKGLKYVLITLLVLLTLVVIALILTQTSWFREIVKNKIEKIAETQLNGKLVIGEINGNIYNNIKFSDVSFSSDETIITSFSSLKIQYNLPALFKKKIHIDSVQLQNPFFYIEQKKDSTWNLQNIIIEKSSDNPEASVPFSFNITALFVSIQNGTVSTSTHNKLIPESVTEFNLLASGSYSSQEISAHLKHLNFQTKNPSLVVNEISTYFNKDKDRISIDSFLVKTSGSKINFTGEMKSINEVNADISANPVNRNELAIFIPSFKLACSPSISAQISQLNDSTKAEIELLNGNESIKLNAGFFNLNKFIGGESVKVPYRASIFLNNVSPENWMEMPETKTIVNGSIQLKDAHLLDYKSQVSVIANLKNSVYNGNKFNTLTLNGNFGNETAQANFDIAITEGSAFGVAKISNIFSKVPEYSFSFKTDNLNITSFIPALDSTVVNANLEGHGSGFSTSEMQIESTVQIYNSSVYKVILDSAKIKARINHQNIFLDTMVAFVPGAFAQGNGKFSLDSNILSSNMQILADSLTFLNPFIILPLSFKTFSGNANVSGSVSDLSFTGNAKTEDFSAYSVKSDNIETSFSGTIKNDTIQAKAIAQALQIVTGGAIWDTISINADYSPEKISALIKADWNDTLVVSLKTRIYPGDTINVQLPELRLKSMFSEFYLPDTLQSVQLDQNSVSVNNLHLKNTSQPNFNLILDGRLTKNEPGKIQLKLENLDINPLNSFIPLQDSVYGIISSTFSLTGTPEKPIFSGAINIKKPGFGNIELDTFFSQINYIDNLGKVEFKLPDLGSSGFANFPMQIKYDTAGFYISPLETFNAGFKIDSLSLSQPLNGEFSQFDISGNIDVDLTANGTLEKPLIFGDIKVKNGYFADPAFGLNYDNISALIHFNGNKINFDTLLVTQKKGFLSANGEVEFDSTIITGDINKSSLTVNASNFQVIKNKDFELLLDAGTFIKMGKNNPEFGGKITILRSEINLPALLETQTVTENEDEPLLIQALSVPADSTPNVTVKDYKDDQVKKGSDFQKNLTGKINLEIPRNTWIRSDNMNMELTGDVELVKTGPYFELFGNIKVIRGYYILYGRRLNIQEGEIIFQGGEEMDPTLNIITEYTFRDSEKVKRRLQLSISGLLSDPEISFTLDGTQTTENDAVSILIFGKTGDETGADSQNGMVGAIGSKMVTKALTSQLSKTLGSRFNLDMIEINATENWQSAAFVVGKYITNDLFLTYQRGFGESEGEEITPETITLEYELNRILFLHLQSGSSKESGLDVILKFEQKKKE